MPFTRSSSSNFVSRSMDKLRRSFRDSFRGRRGSKDPVTESAKPHEWQQDEAAVRAGTCSFHVKYLGCVEVFESRGMQVCEEALKVLRQSRKRRIRGILYVSGDGLRVVDAENKGLVVDQTIEKVSFCAPDRNHERGFGYICRDGTTRRWMCHGFHAVKESGERLSHAVGCAFAVCLEKKQKRDREAATAVPVVQPQPVASEVAASETQESRSGTAAPNFVRQGSFKHASLSDRILDPQNVKPAERPPIKPVVNPHAVSRPSANPSLFERQGSLRIDSSSDGASPFKRNFSLRLNELPSNLSRQQQQQPNGLKSKPLTSVSILESEEQLDPTGKNRSVLEEFSSMSTHEHDRPVVSGTAASGFSSSPALSTASSSRSRADEWLESATITASQLRQYSRQTPPTTTCYSNSPAAVMTPPLSARGAPLGYGGNLPNSMSNGFPLATQGTISPPTVLQQQAQLQPYGGLNPGTTVTTEVDIFGQPVFAVPPVPQRQQFGRRGSSPPLAQRNFQRNVPGTRSMGVGKLTHQAASLDFPIGREIPTVDPFEAKWSALSGKDKNPFHQESSTVHI